MPSHMSEVLLYDLRFALEKKLNFTPLGIMTGALDVPYQSQLGVHRGVRAIRQLLQALRQSCKSLLVLPSSEQQPGQL